MATRVQYVLTNGVVVNTLKEALMSGQGYQAKYSKIPEPKVPMTEGQKARLRKV